MDELIEGESLSDVDETVKKRWNWRGRLALAVFVVVIVIGYVVMFKAFELWFKG
jgi:hypothetical protein